MHIPAPAANTPHWVRLFLPFAVGYYLSYLLRNANAVLAPELTRELNLTAGDLGLLTSAYFLAFGAFQIPLGILLDRFGARRVEAALILFAGLGTFVFAMGHDIATLAVGRALIGFGVSACLMAALSHFAQWYPAERQASLTGAIMASGGLGAISASVPLEALLPLVGWRGVFLLLTGIIAAAAAFIFFAVPERRQETLHTSFGEQWHGVVHIFASRAFWRFAPLMTFSSGGFMAIMGLWIVPWFIEVDGLTREAAARNLFVMGATQLASFFIIAAFATRLIRRGVRPTHLIATALCIASFCVALVTAGVRPSLPLWIVYSFCSATATLMYAALGGYFPASLFGRVSTALNLMAFVGAFSLQWGIGIFIDTFGAAGWSTQAAYRAAFGVVVAMQFLCWGWFVFEGRREKPVAMQARAEPPAA